MLVCEARRRGAWSFSRRGLKHWEIVGRRDQRNRADCCRVGKRRWCVRMCVNFGNFSSNVHWMLNFRPLPISRQPINSVPYTSVATRFTTAMDIAQHMSLFSPASRLNDPAPIHNSRQHADTQTVPIAPAPAHSRMVLPPRHAAATHVST